MHILFMSILEICCSGVTTTHMRSASLVCMGNYCRELCCNQDQVRQNKMWLFCIQNYFPESNNVTAKLLCTSMLKTQVQ